MTARDWLLLLIAAQGAPGGLDPVRLQKGMFLLAEGASLPARERYRFVPYNYGPMSAAIYGDAEALVRAGLAERRAVPGYSWTRVAVTAAGRARARALAAHDASVTPSRARRVAQIKREIAGLGFSALLREIYRRYPEFAARSAFEDR
jgi:hypothetical protein